MTQAKRTVTGERTQNMIFQVIYHDSLYPDDSRFKFNRADDAHAVAWALTDLMNAYEPVDIFEACEYLVQKGVKAYLPHLVKQTQRETPPAYIADSSVSGKGFSADVEKLGFLTGKMLEMRLKTPKAADAFIKAILPKSPVKEADILTYGYAEEVIAHTDKYMINGQMLGNAHTLRFIINNGRKWKTLRAYNEMMAREFLNAMNKRPQIHKNPQAAYLLLDTLLEEPESNEYYIFNLMQMRTAKDYLWKSFHFLENPTWYMWQQRLSSLKETPEMRERLIGDFCRLGKRELQVLEKAFEIQSHINGGGNDIQEIIPKLNNETLLSGMDKLIIRNHKNPEIMTRDKKLKSAYMDKVELVHAMPSQYWEQAENMNWTEKRKQKALAAIESKDWGSLESLVNPASGKSGQTTPTPSAELTKAKELAQKLRHL